MHDADHCSPRAAAAAPSACRRCSSARPRPRGPARLPRRSFSSISEPSGVHGTRPLPPVASRPALSRWKPSTSLAGSMASSTRSGSMCAPGQLHEDAVDFGIGVQRRDQRQQFVLRGARRQPVFDGLHAAFARLRGLVAHVDLARRVLADQHRRRGRGTKGIGDCSYADTAGEMGRAGPAAWALPSMISAMGGRLLGLIRGRGAEGGPHHSAAQCLFVQGSLLMLARLRRAGGFRSVRPAHPPYRPARRGARTRCRHAVRRRPFHDARLPGHHLASLPLWVSLNIGNNIVQSDQLATPTPAGFFLRELHRQRAARRMPRRCVRPSRRSASASRWTGIRHRDAAHGHLGVRSSFSPERPAVPLPGRGAERRDSAVDLGTTASSTSLPPLSNIPSHYLPIMNDDKAAQESRIPGDHPPRAGRSGRAPRATCRCCRTPCAASSKAVRSTSTTASLPSFKGARPYHQAYERAASSASARPRTT